MGDLVLVTILVAILVAVAATTLYIYLGSNGYFEPQFLTVCLESHEETRHKNSWVQIIPVGETTTTIIHPAYDYNVTICDKSEQHENPKWRGKS